MNTKTYKAMMKTIEVFRGNKGYSDYSIEFSEATRGLQLRVHKEGGVSYLVYRGGECVEASSFGVGMFEVTAYVKSVMEFF